VSGCTLGNAFALSGLVIVSEHGKLLRALTALPSLNASREIFHVASGTYSRFVPQTPGKFAGQSLQKRGRGSNFLRKNGAPGAIPTRDLPLRSQSEDVYLRYPRGSQTAQSADLH